MMKCAIVALSQNDNKDNIFGFWREKANVCEMESIYLQESVTVYTFGANSGEICEWREKKLQKAVQKCIKELGERNVKSVYLTDEVIDFVGKEYFEAYFHLPNGRELFDALLCEALRQENERRNIDLCGVKAGIWQSSFDERGYRTLERICDEYKYVSIYTGEAEKARGFAESLYEQTGAAVKVSDNVAEINKCDVIVLLDAPEKAIANEKSVIIDMSGKYPYRCKNTAEFKLAFGFNTFMRYFEIADERCAAFLLDACDITLKNGNVVQYLNNIGCTFKKLLYISNKKC